MASDFKKVLILADYGSSELAKNIHAELTKNGMYGGLDSFDENMLYINHFSNLESDIEIKHHVRGRHVFLLKSFNIYPERWNKEGQKPSLEELVYMPNEGAMELFLLNGALKTAGASEVTNVLPHIPYQRQDRRPTRKGKFVRGPISATEFVKLLEASGADNAITIDAHFKQFESICRFPASCLTSFVIYAEYMEERFKDIMDKIIFVSPDHGSVDLAKKYADYFKRPYAVIDKRRTEEGQSEVMNIITSDELKEKHAVIVDDLIDTGGTIIKAGKALLEKGVSAYSVCCTHPVLSGNARQELLKNNVELATTNSILLNSHNRYPNIKILDVSYLLSKAIWCYCNGESIDDSISDYKKFIKDKKNAGDK